MLKTYIDEWKAYPDLGSRQMCEVEAKKVFNKISRHFKIRAYLDTSYKRAGGTSFSDGTIAISKKTSLDVIAHELAHNFERQKYGSTGHTKRFRKIMAKIVKYIRKKNYWEISITYNIEKGYEQKVKNIEAIYEIRKEDRLKEKCSARKGGIHHWYRGTQTLDMINRKVIKYCCIYCGKEKEEDWSNSNIDWTKEKEKLNEVQR